MFLATVAAVLRSSAGTVDGAEPAVLTLEHPRPFQVVQRTGDAPGAGFANIDVRGTVPDGVDRAAWEFRVMTLAEPAAARGERGSDWAPLEAKVRGTAFEGIARVETALSLLREAATRASGTGPPAR